MKLTHTIYSGIAALLLAAAPELSAQAIDILGITNDGQRAQIKAKVELDGKTLAGVKTYSFNMTDGNTITNTSYDLVDDNGTYFLSADVFYYPDNDGYTYRIELDFSDNTKYISECVTEDLRESFMWLGDYQWTSAQSGWDEAHPPVVDREVDPTLKMTLDGIVYYKGISNHGSGFLEFDFTKIAGARNFTRFASKYGVQDDRPDGDIRFRFITDGAVKVEQVMYSKTNSARGTNPCVRDIELNMEGVNVLRIEELLIDNNWGAHAHLTMARLYLPQTTAVQKKEQTISFNTPSGKLSEDITLDATATSNGNVFYRIISGREYANIEGNVLKPVWGSKGTVVVEATQFGNDTFYPATAYLSFEIDMQPKIEMLETYTPSIAPDNTAYGYLLVDTKGRALSALDVTIYDNAKSRVKQSEKSLLSGLTGGIEPQVVEFELKNHATQVLRVSYRYEGSEQTDSLPYWHAEGAFDYMSDLPFNYGNGYGSWPGKDKPYPTPGTAYPKIAIGITGALTEYAKGFGPHAPGWVETSGDISAYNRIMVDIGAQYYPNRNNSQKLTFKLLNGNTELASVTDATKDKYFSWDYPINNQQKVRIVGDPGSDNNGNDYVAIGAPRLYYTPTVKSAQTITWVREQTIIDNNSTTVTLDATSSNGYTVLFHIAKGGEYASIQGNKLIVSDIPKDGAEIVVDAHQPGDAVWAPAQVVSCIFRLTRGVEVQKNEYYEFGKSDTLDELIVHADRYSSGQVAVKSGIVNVKKYILKYTFIPGEWNYISFPADLDIDKISDFKTKGYNFNAFGAPAYYIKEYDSQVRAQKHDGSEWKMLESPYVKGLKGYVMSIDNSLGDEPVEITFTIDNTGLDLTTLMHPLGLTLDLTDMSVGTTESISVKSATPNVQSNTLTIDVTFNPTDTSSLPIDYAKALSAMRYTFVNNHKAIRLTLPDQTPARVVFFDKLGKKVVKAVRYISPMVIDLRDLKSGSYNMAVEYGPATRIMTINL